MRVAASMILAILLSGTLMGSAQAACRYQGDFLTLYTRAQGIVGNCVTDEFTVESPPGYTQVTETGLLISLVEKGWVGFLTTSGGLRATLTADSYRTEVIDDPSSLHIGELRTVFMASAAPTAPPSSSSPQTAFLPAPTAPATQVQQQTATQACIPVEVFNNYVSPEAQAAFNQSLASFAARYAPGYTPAQLPTMGSIPIPRDAQGYIIFCPSSSGASQSSAGGGVRSGTYNVNVTRVGQDLYKDTNTSVVIQTRYCYEYVYYQDAILRYQPYSYDNKLIFTGYGSSSSCDVRSVS